MPTGPKAPSAQEVADLAAEFEIELSADEAQSYAKMIGGAVHAYRRIEELPERKPPVKYPRGPGYRPSADENPYNAWYWKTEIEGAAEGPLKGERVGVKDAICVAGVPMMNGSQMLEGYVPDIDATIVTRLLDAGAIIAGKTNAEDCCFSGSGHTCALGPVRNPHKPTHGAGGSSSGSAAALAAGDVDMALGGDQGGSIRIPSAWSGVYGLKPTFGLVPYTGCAMIEMTLDHVGPMANSTEGVARMLSVVAGPDPLDPRQRGVIPTDYVRDYRPALERGIKGVKIGLVKEGFAQPGLDDLGFPASEEVVDEKVMAAARRLESLGAEVSEVSIPMHTMGPYIFRGIILEGAADFMIRGNGAGTNWTGFYNTTLAEAFARGRRARANDMARSVRIVLFMGAYLQRNYHGRYYAKAQNVRHHLRQGYDAAFENHDLLLMPTVPFRAALLPEPDPSIEDDLTASGTNAGNTCPTDVTGHPSMSVPCGMAEGLPIGMMITGRHFGDSQVIAAAAAFEGLGDWLTM